MKTMDACSFYAYRIKNQMRFSAHLHGSSWIIANFISQTPERKANFQTVTKSLCIRSQASSMRRIPKIILYCVSEIYFCLNIYFEICNYYTTSFSCIQFTILQLGSRNRVSHTAAFFGSVALLSHFAKCKNWNFENKKYEKTSMAQNA